NRAARIARLTAATTSTGPARPYTSWPGQAPDTGNGHQEPDTELFDIMRELLSGRRGLLGKLGKPGAPRTLGPVASDDELQSVLGKLQGQSPPTVVVDGKPRPRSMQHVKHDVLAQLRQLTPG